MILFFLSYSKHGSKMQTSLQVRVCLSYSKGKSKIISCEHIVHLCFACVMSDCQQRHFHSIFLLFLCFGYLSSAHACVVRRVSLACVVQVSSCGSGSRRRGEDQTQFACLRGELSVLPLLEWGNFVILYSSLFFLGFCLSFCIMLHFILYISPSLSFLIILTRMTSCSFYYT